MVSVLCVFFLISQQMSDFTLQILDIKFRVQCPICLDAIIDSRPMSTICGHVFCVDCITKSIEQNKKCPICLAKLTKSQVHPLYLNTVWLCEATNPQPTFRNGVNDNGESLGFVRSDADTTSFHTFHQTVMVSELWVN